jgi:hypothetical protein
MLYKKQIYWISTITLFSMLILTGVLYFVCHDILVIYFKRYGYPTYLIYPLGVAKIIGSAVVLYDKNRVLKELTYAGFFFNFVLAFFAHYMVNEFDPFPTISLILLFTSYFSGKKVRP